MTREGYELGIAIHPGETIIEYLDSRITSLTYLAKGLDLPPETLKAILDGKVPITEVVAFGLGSVFGSPAQFWIALESNYQETKTRLKGKASTKGR